MLNSFDWLRRCENGAELLATLNYLANEANNELDEFDEDEFDEDELDEDELDEDELDEDEFDEDEFDEDEMDEIDELANMKLASPHSALHSPCQRCWVYSQVSYNSPYCYVCDTILSQASSLGAVSRRAVLIWGFVNQLPSTLYHSSNTDYDFLGAYVYDQHRFLVAIHQKGLKEWIQNLVLYHGFDLRGLLQIFPTMGSGGRIDMSGIFCSIVHREASLPMDQLRVRFFPAPYHVLKPHIRDRQGLLTFGVSDFLGFLEMALVFRSVLHPQEQKILHDLLTTEDNAEKQFFWGRFLGSISQEARDMLYAWNIRQWSKDRVKLLYELTNYVYYR